MKEIKWEDIERVNNTIVNTDIKGKSYAEVNQRIKAFRMLYPMGNIETEMMSNENGVCIFKAYVYDENGKLLSTGTAYEKENSTFINKTSYIENCVPLDTQILTKDGWKFYYQLKIGDEIYSYNMNTKKNEYCKLLKVNMYNKKPLLKMSTSRFDVTCTKEHKWIVRNQNGTITKEKTKNLKVSQKIIQGVKQDVKPSKIGKKLGWLMCDCEINKTKNGMPSTAYINQSKYINELEELFGKGTKTKRYNEDWKDNYEWVINAKEVREILGYFNIIDYKDLEKSMLNANIEDVKGCLESMLLADGEERGFSSTYIELVKAVQTMCARLGISTTFITERRCDLSTKPIYTLGIKKTDGAYVSELNIKELPPQDVWCPTTENGTWFMKQNDFVTMTSNCETSAVGRALGMAGFGIDTSVASAEEVQNAINNQVSYITKEQIEKIKELVDDIPSMLNYCKLEKIEDMTEKTASDIIKRKSK